MKEGKIRRKGKSIDRVKTINYRDEKLSEYLLLREKEKKNKNEFNIEDLLRNENPNLHQIKIGQKISFLAKQKVQETVNVNINKQKHKLDIKQWIKNKDRIYN